MARAPAWTESEFKTLLDNPELSAEDLAARLPKRSVGAVQIVRVGIHLCHEGKKPSMLSHMMLRCLEERPGSFTCPECGTKV